MKISQTSLYQNTIVMNKNVYSDKMNHTNFVQDRFTKQLPTFKGGAQTIEEKILSNPELLKKAAAFLMAGFASLAAKSVLDKKVENEEESAVILTNMFVEMTENQQKSDEQEQKIKELETVLQAKDKELCTKEAEIRLKEKELKDKNYQISLLTSKKESNEVSNDEGGFINVEFPKKRGRLTAEQEELKKTIMLLPSMTEDSANNLMRICDTLINTEPNEKAAKKQKIIMLNEQLQKSGNNRNAINEVIKAFSESEDSYVSDSNSNGANNTDENIFRVEVPTLSSPKILGSIDLENVSKGKITSEVSEIDSARNLSKITIAGSHSTQSCLNKLLNQTLQDAIKLDDGKFVKMLAKVPVNNVSPANVREEIERRKKEGCPYNNITVNDSEEIADLLSTGKFSDLFCLHSAMRLIDRYVDFDNGKVSLEKQCDIIIETLDKAIKQSFKKGLTFKPYKTIFTVPQKDVQGNVTGETEKEYYSSKVFIEPDKLDEEIRNVLGSVKIAVTFSKPDTRYNPKGLKGIISTIFSEGV